MTNLIERLERALKFDDDDFIKQGFNREGNGGMLFVSIPVAVGFAQDKRKEIDAALVRIVEALKFYGESRRWVEIISSGNIFDEQEGDFVDAFDRNQDEPYLLAQNALKDLEAALGKLEGK